MRDRDRDRDRGRGRRRGAACRVRQLAAQEADLRIIVLDQGRVSETGTYDKLIDQAGDFFQMLQLQEDR